MTQSVSSSVLFLGRTFPECKVSFFYTLLVLFIPLCNVLLTTIPDTFLLFSHFFLSFTTPPPILTLIRHVATGVTLTVLISTSKLFMFIF